MTRGAFITIEGGEGVGKSTSLEAIERFLAARGHRVVTTREPGGTPIGEAIRGWILDADPDALSAEVEALLMFAARAQHLSAVIRPALEAGQWVLCDRFTDATVAYQGGGRGLDRQFIARLEHDVQRGLEPDLTLLLDAPVEVGFARIQNRALDHFEREGQAFLTRVRDTYLELAESHSDRIRIVDASVGVEEVEAQIAVHLSEFCATFEAAA